VLSILASGTLVSDPTQKTAASGRLYVRATLRVATEDDSILVSAVAFSETACQALLALSKGDAAAVSGRAKLTTWERGGETNFGMSVVAEQVLTAYALEKKRTRATAKPAEPKAERVRPAQVAAALAMQDTSAGIADLADDLPF